MKKQDVGNLMKFDLHVHSKASPCSNHDYSSLLKEARKKHQKMHLDGIAITDHNTIKGALRIKKMNDRLNKKHDTAFQVIVGEEIMTPYGEILAYDIDSPIKPGRFHEAIEEIGSQDGFCSIAHPFDFIRPSFKLKKFPGAIETFNARSIIFPNIKAKHIAVKNKIAQTGGSDAHLTGEIGRGYTLFTGELAKAIKKKKTMSSGNVFGFLDSYTRAAYRYLKKDIRLGTKNMH